MNIPNLLTLCRILLTPVLVILLIRQEYGSAVLVFTAAGVSDALDGAIARLMKQKTRTGAILDPIADKLLLASSFITLAILGLIPEWLAVIVISRDVIILFGVLILFLFHGGVEIHPTVLSKFTTLVQLATIFLVLVHRAAGWDGRLLALAFAATGLFTMASGLHYMYKGIVFLSQENGSS
jgi:cardiolipin synthase